MNNIDNGPEREEDDSVIGRAFLGSVAVFVAIGLIGGLAYVFLSRKPTPDVGSIEPVSLPERREMPKVTVPTVQWADITDSAKLQFLHDSGATGEKLLPETMGSGCAFF